jgi:hypothetical protein
VRAHLTARQRRRRRLYPLVLALVAASATVAIPVIASAGDPLVEGPSIQPWTGVIENGSNVFDASPQEAPGETWAVSPGGHIYRFTDATGWSQMQAPTDAEGKPVANLVAAGGQLEARATPDGAVALLADQRLYLRDPGGQFHVAVGVSAAGPGAIGPEPGHADDGKPAAIGRARALPEGASEPAAPVRGIASLAALAAKVASASAPEVEPGASAPSEEVEPGAAAPSEEAEGQASTETPEGGVRTPTYQPEAEPSEVAAPEGPDYDVESSAGEDATDPGAPPEEEGAGITAAPVAPEEPAPDAEEPVGDGPPLEPGEQLYDATPLLAALSEGGKAGAFVVPSAGTGAVRDAVLHFDGTGWSREPICLGTAPACTTPPAGFVVLGIDATSAGTLRTAPADQLRPGLAAQRGPAARRHRRGRLGGREPDGRGLRHDRDDLLRHRLGQGDRHLV